MSSHYPTNSPSSTICHLLWMEGAHKGVSGRSRLFWISGPKGRIGSEPIFRQMMPSDLCGCKKYNDALVFFMECRNLHALPSQNKGVVCAINLKCKKSGFFNWRLCIIWKIVPSKNCLQVFQWIGSTRPAKTGYVPDFSMLLVSLKHKCSRSTFGFSAYLVIMRSCS